MCLFRFEKAKENQARRDAAGIASTGQSQDVQAGGARVASEELLFDGVR